MPILLRWLSKRSLRFLHAMGGLLGWAAYLVAPGYRRRFDENAALANMSAAQRRAAIAEAGRLVAEVPRLWLRAQGQPIRDPVLWADHGLLEELLGNARGLVLLTPHLGSFEVAAQAYAERYGQRQPLTVLYRPARQPWLRRLGEAARARPGMAAAPATLAGVRLMLRALKRGEAVGMLPDQVPPQGQGVWVPFFGRPAYTMTLAARLVQQTGATIAMVWTERLARGAGYVIHVAAMPEPVPPESAGDAAAALAINHAMEALIRDCPAQYLWGYHRYKSPRGAAAA